MRKGLASGLTTVAQPLSMGLSAALVALEQRSEALAYLALTLLIVGMVLPLLATRARLLPRRRKPTVPRGNRCSSRSGCGSRAFCRRRR
jgi:hypothetical protein